MLCRLELACTVSIVHGATRGEATSRYTVCSPDTAAGGVGAPGGHVGEEAVQQRAVHRGGGGADRLCNRVQVVAGCVERGEDTP